MVDARGLAAGPVVADPARVGPRAERDLQRQREAVAPAEEARRPGPRAVRRAEAERDERDVRHEEEEAAPPVAPLAQEEAPVEQRLGPEARDEGGPGRERRGPEDPERRAAAPRAPEAVRGQALDEDAVAREAQRDAKDLPGTDRFAVPGEHRRKRHDRRATLPVHRVRERREAFRRAFRHLRSRC